MTAAVLLSAFVLSAARTVLRQVSFWQVKEYRWDRVRAHFALPTTAASLFQPLALGKWGLLALALVDRDLVASALWRALLLGLFATDGLWFIAEVAQRTFRRPRLTVRSLSVMAGTALLTSALVLSTRKLSVPLTLLLLATDRGLPLFVAASVLATASGVARRRSSTLRRAAQTLSQYPQLVRIGITGSFGKSSTKEFLTTILSTRYRVLKTPENVNTEVGVATVIVSALKPDHEVLICELGAYRPGEIARIARVVRPTIGILTAIGDQHLALFRSRENTVQVKGELLRALPPEGVAIVNADDAECLRAAQDIRARRVLRYGLSPSAEVRGTDVAAERDLLTLAVEHGGQRVPFVVSLLGTQQVSNLLGALAAAVALRVPLLDAVEALRAVRPLPRTMEPRRSARGTFIIDDTYSANPAGVKAALNYLCVARGDPTIVVLTSMIELGPIAASAHRSVGRVLATIRPNLVVLTSQDYARDILAGISDVDAALLSRVVIAPRPPQALHAVAPFLRQGAVVLLEGRIPDALRQTLLAT